MASRNRTSAADDWETFERSRGRLIKIAGRVLGSADDAEDLVQDAALRWLQTDSAAVRNPEAWLVAVVSRSAVDRLRRTSIERRARRKTVDGAQGDDPHRTGTDRPVELGARLSSAFGLLRERLGPAERTAFVLREMFGCSYEDIACVLARREAACRQIVHRARGRLERIRPGIGPQRRESPALAWAFVDAVWAGDRDAVLGILGAPAFERPRRLRRAPSVPLGHPGRRPPQRGRSTDGGRTNVSRLLVAPGGAARAGAACARPATPVIGFNPAGSRESHTRVPALASARGAPPECALAPDRSRRSAAAAAAAHAPGAS